MDRHRADGSLCAPACGGTRVANWSRKQVNGDRRDDPDPRRGRDPRPVVIRFAGDSGDGMQLVGDRFTELCAVFGNDLADPPELPAEIRAPAGTIAGVSSFQVHISDHDIVTPGDTPNVLGRDEPRRAEGEPPRRAPGLDACSSTSTRSSRATSPRPGTRRTRCATTRSPRTGVRGADDVDHGRGDQAARREAARRRALEELLRARSHLLDVHASDRAAARLDQEALLEPARGARGERSRVPGGLQLRRDRRAVRSSLRGRARAARAGEYRQITGNVALSYGLVAAAQKAKLPLFYASYPITPASDILHELSKLKNFGVKTLQAEDEIAAAGIRGRCRVRGQPRGHGHERPRRRPEVGGDRPRAEPRSSR